jgi:hypothetical protein
MTWSYEGYWGAVLGPYRSAADVVREFELVARGLDEWLGQAEAEAWLIGHGRVMGSDMPAEWAEHHISALAALQRAAEQAATER